jgi:hypothetical protein
MVPAAPLFAFLLAALVPKIEDPLPDRIGLGFPFAIAGFCGVIAGLAKTTASPGRREQAVNKAGLFGFLVGSGLYLLALAIQVLS